MNSEIYQRMYAVLCGAASDAIDALQNPRNSLYARALLETAILKTEEMYLTATEEELVV